MGSLQGMIRKQTVNALTQFEKLGYNSENIANLNTNGYKTVKFEEVLNAHGYSETVVRRNNREGGFQITNNPLDIAIKGSGYIPVTNRAGEIFYTRDGQFTLNKEGTIVTTQGDIVGSGIKISADNVKVEIKSDGKVYTYKRLEDEPELVGEIPVVLFDNPEALKEVGGNKYERTENSGSPTLQKGHTKIAQHGVERSNVDVFEQVNEILRINAQMLAQTSLITAIDKMYEKAINLRQ